MIDCICKRREEKSRPACRWDLSVKGYNKISRFWVKDNELSSGHAEFEVPVGHLGGDSAISIWILKRSAKERITQRHGFRLCEFTK